MTGTSANRRAIPTRAHVTTSGAIHMRHFQTTIAARPVATTTMEADQRGPLIARKLHSRYVTNWNVLEIVAIEIQET